MMDKAISLPAGGCHVLQWAIIVYLLLKGLSLLGQDSNRRKIPALGSRIR